MDCNVVLVQPAIPQNTGNIARLTAGLRCTLHLVGPMGFTIDDKAVRRAGLDYWPEVSLEQYESWEDFITRRGLQAEDMWFFSTKASQCFTQVEYRGGQYLVFGSETSGLDESFHQSYPERRVSIPIENENIRSFNLANSVAIALFEMRRALCQRAESQGGG